LSGRVVGLGEALVRLSPPGMGRLEAATQLQVEVGGAELNALIAARRCGMEARWLTRIADNPLGRRVAAHAGTHGVEAQVQWEPGARAPVYFVEHGVEPRPTRVLYDRSQSAMVGLDAGSFDFAAPLEGADAVLCSGITCGLGDGPTRAVRELFGAARAGAVRTFFDVNHRAALWAPGAAAAALLPLARRADLVFVGLDEAECLWHTATADDVRALLPEPTTLVVKDGDVGATEYRRAAGADHRTFAPAIPTEVVEAVGAGDAFAAGYLAALLQGADAAARLQGGHQRAHLVLQSTSDFVADNV